VRADLLERNASLELEQKQQHSVLDTRQHRISELEKQLALLSNATKEWKEQFAESEVERTSIQQELTSYVRIYMLCLATVLCSALSVCSLSCLVDTGVQCRILYCMEYVCLFCVLIVNIVYTHFIYVMSVVMTAALASVRQTRRFNRHQQ
jgi:hypothetical protein